MFLRRILLNNQIYSASETFTVKNLVNIEITQKRKHLFI